MLDPDFDPYQLLISMRQHLELLTQEHNRMVARMERQQLQIQALTQRLGALESQKQR